MRAYRNAALTLGAMPKSLAEMLGRGEDLSELPGIGKDLAGNWQADSNPTSYAWVVDTTPPVLTVPTNVVLECPAPNTGTNVTGAATAQDGCGSVTVAYSDTVTTGCGGTKVISRLWTATDACGNIASRVQTITVRDTTPPTLTVPASVVVECPANITTNSTGTATAQDACGQVTLRYSDSVSNSCGGAKVISRLWSATDECGNTTNRIQTITLRDTTPPTLIVPSNTTLECGASTALTLAERGVSVALCEKGNVGGEQSSRNWGWCRKMARDPRELPLVIESLRLWQGMNQRVEAETGFRTCGIMYLAEQQDEDDPYPEDGVRRRLDDQIDEVPRREEVRVLALEDDRDDDQADDDRQRAELALLDVGDPAAGVVAQRALRPLRRPRARWAEPLSSRPAQPADGARCASGPEDHRSYCRPIRIACSFSEAHAYGRC